MKHPKQKTPRENVAQILTKGKVSAGRRRDTGGLARIFSAIAAERVETSDGRKPRNADYQASINFLRKHFEGLHRRSHS